MLLEAGLTSGSRNMAPTLEAVYPSAEKQDTARGKMASAQEEQNRKYGEVPVISFSSGTPWCKFPPTSTAGRQPVKAPHNFRSIETLEKGSTPPGGGLPHRNLLERPEPLYPSAPFKSRLPGVHLHPEITNLSPAEAAHRKSMFLGSDGRPGRISTTQSNPQRLTVRPMMPASSPTGRSVESAPKHSIASAFLHRAFHPTGIPAYPPPGGPIPGSGVPPPHPGLNPIHHPAYAGMPAASAAGFMSLAHILFQPKYPIGKKTFTCHQCRYITDRKNNLKRHIATMHHDSGKFLECCEVIFKSKASLRDHVMMYHRTGYKCRFCGRNFCRKALLKRHLAVHNGQKEFICEVCDYATSHKSNLERHRKIHGLGSPIGSDDEEHFLRDGPDAALYRQYLRRETTMVVERNPKNTTDTSEVSTGVRGELYVDVETIHTDSVSDISTDDVTSVMSDTNSCHDVIGTAMSRGHIGAEKEYVPLRTDPLLDVFPIGTATGKSIGKKAKGPLYLSDRIRQTHDGQKVPELEKDNDYKSPSKTSKHALGSEDRMDKISGNSNVSPGETGRPSAANKLDADAPLRLYMAGEGTPTASDTDQKALPGKGCKRLYASPYKCNECGLGLSSQRKLGEHSAECRKSVIEPPRPMKPLTVAETGRDARTHHPLMPRAPTLINPLRLHTPIYDKPFDLSSNMNTSAPNSDNRKASSDPPPSGRDVYDMSAFGHSKRSRYDIDADSQGQWSERQPIPWRREGYRISAAPSFWRGDYSVRRLVGDVVDAERLPVHDASPSEGDDEGSDKVLPIKKRSLNYLH